MFPPSDVWTPRAVVFDCDGLLMDTEPCWTIAETELFRRRGMGFGVEEKAMVIGRSLGDAARTLADVFDQPGAEDAIIDELMQLVLEAVTDSATPMPGATEIVERAARSVPVAVASNSPRRLMDAALARGGFLNSFDVSVAADEVAEPKPSAEMYLTACSRLGVQPEEALAFEDSQTGLRSARAAGVRLVGVPTLPGTLQEADWLLETLEDERLTRWADRWEPLRPS